MEGLLPPSTVLDTENNNKGKTAQSIALKELPVKGKKKAINNHKNECKPTTPINSKTDSLLTWFKPKCIPHETKI